MGVTGLWRLLEPAGAPVHLDALRGRTLAVDISIWLHQMVKGFQDAKGAAVANSHLFGLFQRLCKLLYYGIKPVFVFDGCFPALKRQTIINRQNKKASARNSADKVQQQLMEVIAKHIAVKNSLTGTTSPQKLTSPIKKVAIPNEEDLFVLPSMQADVSETTSNNSEEEEEEVKESISSKYQIDLHSFDVNSEDFKNLNPREKHDLLTELKETRKASSWGRLHELPSKSQDFSDYQMQRLLKRRQVQVTLEETEKEIGGNCLSINELEILLNEEGIDTKICSIPTRQIASNENARFLLVKDVKEAIEQATKKESVKKEEDRTDLPSTSKTDDLGEEFDEDLASAIKLSLEEHNVDFVDMTEKSETNSTVQIENKNVSVKNAMFSSVAAKNSDLSIAKAYMKEYSGLSEYEIDRILKDQTSDASHPEKNIENSDLNEIVSNEKLDNRTRSQSNDQVSSTNIIDLTSHIEETSKITKVDLTEKDNSEKNLDENTDALSTSSEDSFEEVPDVYDSKNITSNNDIFADVFNDESKFQTLEKNIVNNIKSKLQQSENIVHSNESNSLNCEKDAATEISSKSEDNVLDIIDDENDRAFKIENDGAFKIENDSDDDKSEASQMSAQDDVVDSENPLENELNRPVNTSNEHDISKPNPISLELISDLEKNLEKQQDLLEKEQNRLDRMGRNITEEMTKDAQHLLRLFGIPYIVAPTEAEAQCAFLESINLTDGTITDDSDIWLFGGKTVYRNFFNQQKHVLKFASENINKSFKLQREDLILLALLVGSDYTMGVTGVGPVTALEILAAFPRNKCDTLQSYQHLIQGLKKFREWCSNTNSYTHTSLRSKLKNISLSEEFPNIKVIEAYLSPEIETSKEPFSWGVPDVAALRDYTKDKFGWSREKTDEILNPVLKRLGIKSTQLSIKSFYDTEFKIDTVSEKMSKRVRKAIENIDTEKVVIDSVHNEEEASTSKKVVRKRIRKECNMIKKQKKNPNTEISNINVSMLNESTSKFKSQHCIPQRENDKSVLLKNKMKAIEIFRKSKQGPGFVKRRKKAQIQPKDDAELSESSSSS